MRKQVRASVIHKAHEKKGVMGNKGWIRRPTLVKASKTKGKSYGSIRIWE